MDAERAKRRAWTAAQVCLGVGLSAGLGWLAARGLDWGMVGDAFLGVSLPLVALAMCVFFVANCLRAARWRLLFVDGEVSVNRLFIIQNVGIGLNNVVPIRIASEAVQLAILSLKDGVRPSVALATLGMERVLDVLASVAILSLAFFFIPELERFEPYVWGSLALAAACVALVRLLAWSGGVKWARRLPFLATFGEAVREMERRPARLAASGALSVTYWLLVGATAWLLSSAISLSITPVVATLVIMSVIFFATAVPAAPAAIGTFEFAVVYVLEAFGVSREASFGFAALTHAAFFLPPTLMAAVFLPREGIGSARRLRELIADGRARRSDSA